MKSSYDVDVCNALKKKFVYQNLHRPMRVGRYDPGTRLTYDVTGVEKPDKIRVHLEIERTNLTRLSPEILISREELETLSRNVH